MALIRYAFEVQFVCLLLAMPLLLLGWVREPDEQRDARRQKALAEGEFREAWTALYGPLPEDLSHLTDEEIENPVERLSRKLDAYREERHQSRALRWALRRRRLSSS